MKSARCLNGSDSIPRLPDGTELAPTQAIEHLLQANKILNESPAQAIQWLAQSYGVDLAQLAQGPQTPADPMSEIQAAMAHWRQEEQAAAQQQLQREREALHMQMRQAEERRVQGLLEDFTKDKPYWSQMTLPPPFNPG
ncbi:MAG: hypothetical protein ACM3IH_11670 [Sphingobacteriales bacterium]